MLGHDPAAFAFPPEQRTLAACWLDLIHPSDRDAANGYLASYLRQPDRPFDLRFRMRRRDGNWAWIWSRGQMLSEADGRPTGLLVGTHIDVTESMRAEEALRENERKYRMLAENMKDVVWIADVETNRYLYVSRVVDGSILSLLDETQETVKVAATVRRVSDQEPCSWPLSSETMPEAAAVMVEM